MTHRSIYQASKAVAEIIERIFEKHIQTAVQNNIGDIGTAPRALQIQMIIDIAFWASLRKEEGQFTKISLALMPPEQAGYPMVFWTKDSSYL